MTSSLVGSEMCIRDSPNCGSDWGVTPCEHQEIGRDWGVHPCQHQEIRPVSYTHLTLPTICSV
eukprot:3699331-Prorocentrum_lima.AAC.1